MPFIGSEALASGSLNRHQLRTRFTALCPDVYFSSQASPVLRDRITAAWLWSRRTGVVAGLSAAALHGAKWIADDAPVELVCSNPRPPHGVITRRCRLLTGESQLVSGLPVTTAARTAFDVGRQGRVDKTVARIDALMQATNVTVAEITELAARHPGVRGFRQLEVVLELADSGSQSPRETSLRLLLMRNGFPRPQTQIPVLAQDGRPLAYLDMGWPELMVAVEYDGDHHRSDRRQYVSDIRRYELLEKMGWIVVRVVAEDHPADILRRVRDAVAVRRS
ncbi:hypothetical protein [Mycobacterium sp. 1274761.0]|uniref:hypothetical protein n=1 Tax=Mycobacterium sp. 1274761.0 TaxID=1834077 RepID=UPI0007FDC0A7|nr:hypothetical protein [Mycobacterium sp. 1274761.0]OBK70831.1 hypothetical protein A5651_20765 [Mycobacterium sp. 1274761.0]